MQPPSDNGNLRHSRLKPVVDETSSKTRSSTLIKDNFTDWIAKYNTKVKKPQYENSSNHFRYTFLLFLSLRYYLKRVRHKERWSSLNPKGFVAKSTILDVLQKAYRWKFNHETRLFERNVDPSETRDAYSVRFQQREERYVGTVLWHGKSIFNMAKSSYFSP